MGRKKSKGKLKPRAGSPSHTTTQTEPHPDFSVHNEQQPSPIADHVQPAKGEKTQEERRKEIEVLVAAATLIQMSSAVKIGPPVLKYWKTMSAEKKRSFLKVSFDDLRAHYAAVDMISESISFVQSKRTWKFWACCYCGERFMNCKAHYGHMWMHIEHILPECYPNTPKEVDSHWEDMLLNGSWEPVDLNTAMKILQENESHQHLITDNSYDVGSDEKCSSDDASSKDTQQVQELDEELESVGDVSIEGLKKSGARDNITIPSSGVRGDGNKQKVEAYPISQRWPSCDDPERAKLLEKIHVIFQLLLKHNCLADSHIQEVISYTMKELEHLFPGFGFLECGLDQTPVCICFLGATQLQNVLSFLQELSNSCKLGEHSEKTALADENWDVDTPVTNVTEGISVSDDSSHLILNEFPLTAGIVSDRSENAGMDAGEIASDLFDDGGLDGDSFLSWLFTFSSTDFESWIHQVEDKTRQRKKILQMITNELNCFVNLCKEKSKHVGYIEELKEQDTSVEHMPKSSEALVKKRQEELMKREVDPLFISYKFQPLATSTFLDLYSSQPDNRAMQVNLNEADKIIIMGMKTQRKKISMEISKLDARIRQRYAALQQLKRRLGAISAFDFQKIMLVLVKTFLREHLECLAEKYAKEKSDAARESLLAELALEDKNNTDKGDTSKHIERKSKKKKKKKDNRNTKMDLKGIGLDKVIISDQKFAAEVILHSTTDVDVCRRETENVGTESGQNLKQPEEEFFRKTRFEEEERKLEEVLEYQRRIENEPKQTYLAEKYGKECEMYLVEMSLENITGALIDAKSQIDYQDPLEEQWQRTKKVSIQSNSSQVSSEGMEIAGPCSPKASIVTVKQNNELTFGSFTPDELLKLRVEKVPFTYHKKPQECDLSGGSRLPKDSISTHKNSIEKSAVPGPLNRSLTRYDDERFQADLGKVTRESLGTLQALPDMATEKISMEVDDDVRDSHNEVGVNSDSRRDAVGKGLKNDIGENNCFLNVIIQSLWHIRRFREEFLTTSTVTHSHLGDPCIICALYRIFRSLHMSSTKSQTEAVDPTDLRIGLSNLYHDKGVFQVRQENDASEVMEEIFKCLHQTFTSCPYSFDSESKESEISSLDLTSKVCIAHSLFGIFRVMKCNKCHLERRCPKYTPFFYLINAYKLRRMKIIHLDSSFEDHLKLLASKVNDQSYCDVCGKKCSLCLTLSIAPHVLVAELNWQSHHESAEDISATLATVSIELDIGAGYPFLGHGKRYYLISVVCYSRRHYCCFSYSRENDQWAMYNDTVVKAIGGWGDILTMCVSEKWQPLVLFYEAVN